LQPRCIKRALGSVWSVISFVDGVENGDEQIELEDNEDLLTSTRDLVMGYIHDDNGERFTEGAFDEMRVWTRAQTEADLGVYMGRTLPASIIEADKDDRVVLAVYHMNEPENVPYVFDAVKRDPEDIADEEDFPAHGSVTGGRSRVEHGLDDGAF